MFVSLSKTLARFGKIRIGAGLRITKKNALWMSFVWLMVVVVQMTWYMMVLCFWLVYAVVYCMIIGIRAFFRFLRKLFTRIIKR